MSRYPLAFTDADDLQRRIDAYFDMCNASRRELPLKNGDFKIRYDIPCTIIGLCNYLNISHDTLYNYMNGDKQAGLSEEVHNSIATCLANARSRIEQLTLDRALSGDYEPKIASRILSGFGYSDKSDDGGKPVTVILQGEKSTDWAK